VTQYVLQLESATAIWKRSQEHHRMQQTVKEISSTYKLASIIQSSLSFVRGVIYQHELTANETLLRGSMKNHHPKKLSEIRLVGVGVLLGFRV